MNEKQLKSLMAQIVRNNAKRLEEEQECARCGEWVKPSDHPEIGCDL